MDMENLTEKIKISGAKKVFVQLPEGLKPRALDIVKAVEKSGAAVILGCDPCYGACDLRDKQAKALGCDLLLHIGHSSFGLNTELPVIYYPYEIETDFIPHLKKHIDKLEKYKKISILTTIQFAKALGPAKTFLEKRGKEVLFAKHAKSGVEGVLLGCDCSAALPLEEQVDCFIFIGSGKFHPLGLARKTNKPVISLDIETGELNDFSKEKLRLEKVKAFHISQAREATIFGILVSVKPGQFFLEKAEKIKRQLEESGKDTFILAMDEISPSKIAGMPIEVLVNCACPRLDEDFSLFKKPILNPEDIQQII